MSWFYDWFLPVSIILAILAIPVSLHRGNWSGVAIWTFNLVLYSWLYLINQGRVG